MFVKKQDFEQIVDCIDYSKYPEISELVTKILSENDVINDKQRNRIKEKRKENPEYGHSKEEIENMRRKENGRSLGI